MLFNSLTFVGFLLLVLPLYFCMRRKAQNLFLLLASAVFYGAWDWRFLGLLYFSVVLDFWCGAKIAEERGTGGGKQYLVFSVIANLGVLGFFKYFNFFTESFVELMTMAGLESEFHPWNIVLPLGISFYTFQSMSYTIDIYRGHVDPVKKLTDFAVYVTFFPQLVAGPIERATTLIPQILSPRSPRWSDLREGAFLVLSGYFKKLVIADNLAPAVEYVFDFEYPEYREGVNILIGIYSFAFQLYGDFAGYTDIARGVAKWMGFDLMVNFRRPYLAANPSEFWRRWHISLSTWLRDYVYIPFGGNRRGRLRTYLNLFLTMTIGGLWHGAAGHFVAWGAAWGILLAIHHAGRDLFAPIARAGWAARLAWRLLATVVTFHSWCLILMLFRVHSMDAFWTLLARLLGDFQIDKMAGELLSPVVYFIPVYFVFEILDEILAKGRNEDVTPPWWLRTAQSAIMIALLIFHGELSGSRFIYFQF
jgi:D-alanyl-lipoteichoic acid acyltransferase DltB (MBOAT superfamily)